jgi:hypothetical protein
MHTGKVQRWMPKAQVGPSCPAVQPKFVQCRLSMNPAGFLYHLEECGSVIHVVFQPGLKSLTDGGENAILQLGEKGL